MAKDIGRNRLIQSEDEINQEDFKGYRAPGGIPNMDVPEPEPEPTTEDFKGFRGPGGTQSPPEPEYEQPPEDNEKEFVHWWGKNFLKGSKEEKKLIEKDKEKEKKLASTPPKEKDEIDRLLEQSKVTTTGAVDLNANPDQADIEKYGEDWPRMREGWEGFKAAYTDIPDTVKQIYHKVAGNEKDFAEVTKHANEIAQKYDSTPGRVGYFLGALSQSIPELLMSGGTAAPAVAANVGRAGLNMFKGPIAKAVIRGGIQDALATPTKSESSEGFWGEKLKQTAIGGGAAGLGGLIGKGISKLTAPTAKTVGAVATKDLAEQAEKLGIKLTPAQVTGDKALGFVEEGLRSSPGSAGVYADIAEQNQKVFNKLAVKAIDPTSTAEAPTADFLNKAWQGAEEGFEKLRDVPEIQLDSFFKGKVKDINKKIVDVTIKDESVSPTVKKMLSKFYKQVDVPEDKGLMQLAEQMEKAGEKGTADEFRNLAKATKAIKEMETGKMSGNDFVSSTKMIRDMARDAGGETQHYLRQLSDEMENAAERNLSFRGKGEMVQSLKNARTQMAKVSRIRDSVVTPMSGDIDINKLYSKSKQKGILQGGKDLMPDLEIAAEINKTFKPFLKGISPTAERTKAIQTMESMVLPMLGGGAGSLAGGPLGGLLGAIGTMGASNLAAKGMTSDVVMKNILKGSPQLNKLAPILQQLFPELGGSAARTGQR